MKTLTKGCIGIALIFYAAAVMAGQTQHIAPGEVPEGITVEDWGIVQEAYLKASNTEWNDNFGWSVSFSADTIVVGAGFEESSSTGVNGNQADNSASEAGAAYVFVRNGSTWSQQAYLKASNTDGGDIFGSSVAISGDTIVVGAPKEESSTRGVNSDESDNSIYRAGAAYVFVRNGTTWTQQAYLKASNTDKGDYFGCQVAVSGDTIVVGSIYEQSSATGINGNQTDNSASSAGAAYVFVRNGSTWSQQAYLKASNTGVGDFFGSSVAISGDSIVVGARGEDSVATGVNGNQADNSAAPEAGAAYVFVRDGTTWSQQAYLKASNTDDHDNFGRQVAVSDNTIVVGALGEESSATGVNGNEADNSASMAGAAYVFVRNGTTWTQQAYLKGSNTEWDDYFSRSVSVSADTIVVGASSEESSSTGVNGNQADNSAPDSGAAYVFVRNGTTWTQQAYLKASNTDMNDYFGCSVAISGDSIVVGALGESSSSTGVNGNQSNNSIWGAGAAYVFTGFTPGDYQATITDCSSIASGFILEWIPADGWDSVVKCSTDLENMPFTDLSAPLPYPVNSYTDTVSNGKCFYKVDLQP